MAINKKTLVFVAAAASALLLLATAAPAAASPALGPRRGLKNNNNNNNNPPLNQLSAPTIECIDETTTTINLQVCATGDEGSPNGVKLIFETLQQFIDAGGFPCPGQDANTGLCTAKVVSALEEGDCTTVVLGTATPGVTFNPSTCSNPLLCGQTYVIRGFSLGSAAFNASDFSATVTCGTDACPECTTDADCTDPLLPICLNGDCVECAVDEDCPMGSECVDNVCVPTTGCTDDSDCAVPGEVCVDNMCVCPPGSVFDEMQQACVCDVNFFSPTGVAPCTPCPPGTFTNGLTGQTTCLPPVNPPGVCFDNSGEVCGFCVDANADGGRGCDANVNQQLICSLYGVPLETCVISAVTGGGAACGPTTICCAVVQPSTIPPDANGVCPIVPLGFNTAVKKAAGAKKP